MVSITLLSLTFISYACIDRVEVESGTRFAVLEWASGATMKRPLAVPPHHGEGDCFQVYQSADGKALHLRFDAEYTRERKADIQELQAEGAEGVEEVKL